MYKIFKDINKTFVCDIEIEGANINESVARIILETDDNINLLYSGKINQNGKCEVLIDKMKLLPENTRGKISLEVIAEGTLFTPWESTFVIETSKKVNVTEVYDSNKKDDKIVKVKLNEDLEPNYTYLDKHVNILKELVKEKNIGKDKIHLVLEKYEGLLAVKNKEFNKKELEYISKNIF